MMFRLMALFLGAHEQKRYPETRSNGNEIGLSNLTTITECYLNHLMSCEWVCHFIAVLVYCHLESAILFRVAWKRQGSVLSIINYRLRMEVFFLVSSSKFIFMEASRRTRIRVRKIPVSIT